MHTEYFNEYKCVYDDKNNLLEVFENNILTCKYTYDTCSRLIREDNLPLDSTITYSYNEYNKLKSRRVYKYSLSNLKHPCYTDNYKYSKNKPHKLLTFNNEKFDYDNLGNPIVYRDAKLKWSNSKNLLSIDSIFSYKYNNHNVRKSKTTRQETTTFCLKKDKIQAQKNGNHLIFIRNCENEICGFSAKLDGNTQSFTYKKNFNGDVVGIYNEKCELICKYVYDAFGNHKILIKNDNEYLDVSFNLTGNKNFSFIASINPYRFHCQYFDIETGLYYINGKYYDSEIGNYINN